MEKKEKLTRRNFLPILGSAFLIPLVASSKENKSELGDDEAFEILLKPDGTTVKVRKTILQNSEPVKKNVTNPALLSWLTKK
ncbi:MAG: hypothetical protein CVT98_02690 [Bacteroidetes bacterium HGW-Bacteroidetes-15]|jgi:hypothetical protein|nr:hypothetical protein [Flavobacteriaceae bacterium]PKP39222.1 MAG: hypothetical protein CVT98_02690 [Bacteroidetes bacterium HGW-Bacteroidetes-15]PKP39706.1 MAG: hypothetical protein CVT96_11725 [Bacteroidetes bacterium HGW-Bacteroidetes-13]